MTMYGTIPTSSSSTVANIDPISNVEDRLKSILGTQRPWPQMFDYHSFNLPINLSDAVSRIKLNLDYFRMNHFIVVILLLFLSLLWHPISLVIFISMAASWYYIYISRNQPLMILGRPITDSTVSISLAVATVGLLWLTGALSDISSGLSFGVLIVLLHSVFRKIEDLYLDGEAAGLLNATTDLRAPPPRVSP